MVVIYAFKTGGYSRQIYISGTQRFTARDGFVGIPTEYHQPVKEYAAKNFTLTETDNALTNTWITQQEYDDTVPLRTELSPMSAPTQTI
jgi:hypothetical protein